jgi:hypothetical protein
MRLTGVGQTSPLVLDLFVFGPSQARVDGMDVRWCGRVRAAEPEAFATPRWRGPRLDDDGKTVFISHAGVRATIAGAGVLTRLVGTIPVHDMDKDFAVRWHEYSPSTAWGFSQEGVYEVAALAAAATLFAALFVRAMLRRRIRHRQATLLGCFVLCLAAGVGFRVLSPQIPVLKGNGRYGDFRHLAHVGMSWTWGSQGEGWPPKPAAEVKDKVRQAVAAADLGDIAEGDAPGCWTVRDGAKGAEMIVYDAFGSEYSYPLFWEP